MYWVDEIDNKWNELYFISLVFFGSFFVVNLVVAVIFIRFDQMKSQVAKEQTKAMEEKEEQAAKVAALVKQVSLSPRPGSLLSSGGVSPRVAAGQSDDKPLLSKEEEEGKEAKVHGDKEEAAVVRAPSPPPPIYYFH